MRRWWQQRCVGAAALILLGSCGGGGGGNGGPGGTQSVLSTRFINTVLPPDVPGGAPNATLRDASLFAWQEFIALNWPARPGHRDQADVAQSFGDPSFSGPLVWQTFRSKVEIYPGSGDPPGFVDDPRVAFGYDTPEPQYVYGTGEIGPCIGQAEVETPAWINLDEVSQILLDQIFSGVVPVDNGAQQLNSEPRRLRFAAKANRHAYTYVVDPATSYWKQGTAFQQATANYLAVANGNGEPLRPPGPVIRFPVGTIEVKSTWRILTAAEEQSGRFYGTSVRYYEADASTASSACYREGVWGLLGLHIMHKTPTAPLYTYATFEQADSLVTQDGAPVEDDDGRVILPAASPMTPMPTAIDGTTPMISIGDQPFCEDPGARLFYREMPIGFDGAAQTGLPTGGNICVNQRLESIPSTVVQTNHDVHDALRQYLDARSIADSPWLHYKLINVQWRPFDLSEVNDDDADSPNNGATFWTANIASETDDSLQFFSGQLDVNGARTDLPPNFDRFDPARTTFQNVLAFNADGTLRKTYNMGGCMGCHGTAAVQIGTDFSFILADGPTAAPEPLQPAD
jgi:hypothetical protein